MAEGNYKAAKTEIKVPGMRGPRNWNVEKAKDRKGTLNKLLPYFLKEKRLVIGLFIMVILGVCFTVLAPMAQSKAIDQITGGNFEDLPAILAVMVVFYILQAIFTLYQGVWGSRISQSLAKNLRADLFDKIIDLPVGYLDHHRHGDIMSRMTNDVDIISQTTGQSLCSLLAGIFTIFGTVAVMLYYCIPLTLLSCVTVIFTVFTTRKLSKIMRRFYRQRQKLLGGLNSAVDEMVSSYHTVVAMNGQEHSMSEFNELSDELTKVGIKADILGGSMGPIMNVINNTGFVIIAAFGGFFALKGMISVGVISAFIVYAKQFSRPINELANLYGQIQTAIAGAERVFELMEEESEDLSGDYTMEGLRGIVEFSQVDFSYLPGRQVLYDFSLKIPEGKKVALVGATGSGKTTIVNLLMRFYDVDRGRILIDGVNIKDIGAEALRRNTAIVLQDTVLFSDSIRANLKYSNASASDEAMEEAAKNAGVYRMIRQLRDGFDTILHGGGSSLSQGQRQLLSIGRAFLADPKILILDEATSSVDTRTERQVQDAMARLMKDRTSIIIAHRLSTIKDADLIVVMDQGRIVEEGRHEELLAKKGRYYDLYTAQYEGVKT